MDLPVSSTEHVSERSHRESHLTSGDYSELDAFDLFAKSINIFRSSLTEQQNEILQSCSNVESMVEELEKICRHHKHRSILMVCCQRLQKFSEAFRPYFDVVGIFVSVKPLWFGVFWGSIRLLFQVIFIRFCCKGMLIRNSSLDQTL